MEEGYTPQITANISHQAGSAVTTESQGPEVGGSSLTWHQRLAAAVGFLLALPRENHSFFQRPGLECAKSTQTITFFQYVEKFYSDPYVQNLNVAHPYPWSLWRPCWPAQLELIAVKQT